MFSQKFSAAYKGLLASFLLLASSSLMANLIININQVFPFPPSITCGDGGTPVQVGGTVTYAITVTNNGPTDLRSVVFDDSLQSDVNPTGICLQSVASCSQSCDDMCVTTRSNGFHANIRKLGVDQSLTFTVTYRVCTGLNPNGMSTLTNSAVATGVDTSGTLINSGFITQTSCVQGCALAVTVDPSVPTNVCAGALLTLTAIVMGSCEDPSQATYAWLDPNSNPTGTNSPLLVIDPSLFPAGSIWSVTVTDNFTGCMRQGFSGAITSALCADLAIVKTGQQNGDLITYTITVTNNGPEASLVTINDCFPACLTINQVNFLGGSNWSYTINNNCLTAQLNSNSAQPINLPAGQSASLEVVTQITGSCGKSICNTATVEGSLFDPNPSNNSSTFKIKNK